MTAFRLSPRRRGLAALSALFFLAGSATIAAAATPDRRSYPTGRLLIGGQVVPAAKVLDARAIPDMTGKPSLMVTIDPAAAAAIVATARSPTLPVTLDGRPLGEAARDTLAQGGTLQFGGAFGDYEAAATLARRISGRDPLPETEGD